METKKFDNVTDMDLKTSSIPEPLSNPYKNYMKKVEDYQQEKEESKKGSVDFHVMHFNFESSPENDTCVSVTTCILGSERTIVEGLIKEYISDQTIRHILDAVVTIGQKYLSKTN